MASEHIHVPHKEALTIKYKVVTTIENIQYIYFPLKLFSFLAKNVNASIHDTGNRTGENSGPNLLYLAAYSVYISIDVPCSL